MFPASDNLMFTPMLHQRKFSCVAGRFTERYDSTYSLLRLGLYGSPVKFASLLIFDKFNGAGRVQRSGLKKWLA